jgi:hypothetical protein
MPEDTTPHTRHNEDGSLDVWVEGWRIRFEGESKPTTTPDQDVPEEAEIGAPDLHWWADESGIWIRLDGWYVQIRDGVPQVMPARPTSSGSGTFALRLYRRHVD